MHVVLILIRTFLPHLDQETNKSLLVVYKLSPIRLGTKIGTYTHLAFRLRSIRSRSQDDIAFGFLHKSPLSFRL
jgi:hypothetical protein